MPDGRIAQRPFGRGRLASDVLTRRRDRAGHPPHAVGSKLERFGVKVYEEYFRPRWQSRTASGAGVVAYNMRNGRARLVTAKATIFATGGLGRVYRKTTNGYASTADGRRSPTGRRIR